jgi:hypothetical protein
LHESLDAEMNWINHFSIPYSTSTVNPSSCVVVIHLGTDMGLGSWVCSKDKVYCAHIKRAKDHLAMCRMGDPEALAPEDSKEADIVQEKPIGESSLSSSLKSCFVGLLEYKNKQKYGR